VEVEARRRELETMLETIPNGVVMLDSERRIRVVNRAFSEMMDPGGQRAFVGLLLDQVIPAEGMEVIERLLRRSHRMGSAAAEAEMSTDEGTLNLAVTAAILENISGGTRIPVGYVVVLENATELLRAQKQSAWKEVARRVAHEIKNPLTPISLNAEQIRRHIVRLGDLLQQHELESPSVATIRRSSEVISASVESMRGLVDQFSSLAEFPSARPRPADLNTIVENTLSLFAGRLSNITVVQSLQPHLPLVMADPEAIKRALSNLIDNAAEAMNGSLLREIHIETRRSEQSPGMIEMVVADTGPGVTDDMRERLFLPYFSTKQRGTGLGLTIAAKIMADHQGTIRAEKNLPTGARFLLELPIAGPQEGSGQHRIATEGLRPASETSGTSA
jgi:nitrogen fixation/metabolism regulation signal transduction histidine kinase